MSIRGSVVIVTYNAEDSIQDCLASLEAEVNAGWLKVIVVDNNSTDHTIDIIQQNFGWVELISAGENGGFGAGNNLGYTRAEGDWVFILNPDSKLSPGCIECLERCLLSSSKNGCVGPGIKSETGQVTISFFPFTNLFYSWWLAVGASRFIPLNRMNRKWRLLHHAPQSQVVVDRLLGAAMMIRRTVWEQVGGYDERFFLYSEEEDLCKRIEKAGSDVIYCPEAQMMHTGAGSTQKVMPLAIASANWSRYVYQRMHCSKFSTELSRLIWLGSLIVRYLMTGILHKPAECREQRMGYRMSIKSLWCRGWFDENVRPPRRVKTKQDTKSKT